MERRFHGETENGKYVSLFSIVSYCAETPGAKTPWGEKGLLCISAHGPWRDAKVGAWGQELR